MMDCKKALVETDGDFAAAEEILRTKFAAKAATRANRETAEGRIGVNVAVSSAVGIVELRCETAPTANSELFVRLAEQVASAVAESGKTDPEQVAATTVPSASGKTVESLLKDAYGNVQENMQVARAARLEGSAFASYVHHNGKIGVICSFESSPGEVGKQVCMHIAHARPIALRRDQLPAEMIERERSLATQQVPPGKPDNIVEKIIDGKINRWCAEQVLLEQPFVMDEKTSVGKVLEQSGGAITGFCRLEVGSLEPIVCTG
jgi:elongation factor Ts